jgi:PAS domain S-box-containing protein
MNNLSEGKPHMRRAGEFEHAKLDLLEAIVEQAADAIIFADRDGVIQIWNQGAERVFGYAAGEVVGKTLDVIIPERLRDAHWEGFRRAVDTDQPKYKNRVLTTRSMHKNGSKLYLDLSFGLIRDRTGAIVGAVAIGRDCTTAHLAGAGGSMEAKGR